MMTKSLLLDKTPQTNWQKIKIGDIADVIGGGTPSTKNYDFWNGDISWLTPKDLSGYKERYISKGERNITTSGLQNSSARLLPKGTVLLTSRAPIGYLAIAKQEVCTNQGFKSIILKGGYLPEFFYYLLKNNIEYIIGMSSGSTFAEISGTQVKNLEFNVPDYDTQKKIAGVLGALDDKIELNNKINQNLEAQAQALFKSWFVDFEPFGGQMPSDWKIGKLGDICECLLGGTPNRNIPEFWNGNIPWINSGEVNAFRITKPSEYISELGLSKSATKLLPAKTTVIAITGATLGKVSLLEINSCANQSVVGVLPNSNIPYEFIYPFVKHNILELISHQTGGAQQHINKQNVEQIKLYIPPYGILHQYQTSVKPIYKMIANNCFENTRLAEVRDILLPKLMSGEISVDDVKID